jgi:hypothetical protein
MVKEGDARAPFQLRDIRRTAETMLAGLGVSKDVRAHLLSHGLGGMQNQHYDLTWKMRVMDCPIISWAVKPTMQAAPAMRRSTR